MCIRDRSGRSRRRDRRGGARDRGNIGRAQEFYRHGRLFVRRAFHAVRRAQIRIQSHHRPQLAQERLQRLRPLRHRAVYLKSKRDRRRSAPAHAAGRGGGVPERERRVRRSAHLARLLRQYRGIRKDPKDLREV